MVLSALRHKPHPSHATLDQAVAWARRIGARHTWLTHIAHELAMKRPTACCQRKSGWPMTAWSCL